MEERRLRILAVNAHPHDFTHYSGTLGIHASLGDRVTVVSMTPGANVHNEKLADELGKPPAERDPGVMSQSAEAYAAMKAEELRRACALFGVADVRVLGFAEPFGAAKHPEAVDALKAIILELRPDVMITQSPYLTGPDGLADGTPDDHAETAYASLEAKRAASIATVGSTEPPHKIAATYFPGVYFQRNQHHFVVDIGDWFERRVQAEATFVSQGHTPESSRQRVLFATGGTGFLAGVQYAEAFVREKAEVLPRIIVPEAALGAARESHRDMVRRRLGERE